ncbi:MAG: hypothetical protein JWO20_2391 [Candidatus Angelobacter sp.]|nr:hypothetical protein [Candidatus Angelobacter sp.]
MSTAVLTNRLELSSVADTVLKAAARFWFLVVLIGQLVFAFTVGSFYGLSALRGDFHGWSKSITHGHVPGDTVGNFAVAMHLASAVVIILAGVFQLIPQIRNRFPVFHRWNGRLYVVTAFTISLAGLYMMWIRGSVGDLSQHLGTSLMAVLIMLCAAMALHYARARDFKTHRRWALRLYLVVSASLSEPGYSSRFSSITAPSVSIQLRFGARSSRLSPSPNTLCPLRFLKSIFVLRSEPARPVGSRWPVVFLY